MVDSGFVYPAESAALDEVILEAHVAGLVPNTLHFYRRSVPTVSVGYFQRVHETLDLEECARRGVAVIRRKSGGSSIYTDQGQLIYALVVGERDVSFDRAESFKKICGVLVDALKGVGADAQYRPINDIEIGGKKISGNAQLRRKGSLLQHGTLIVESDLDAMDAILKIDPSKSAKIARPSDRVTSLTSALGRAVSFDALKDSIVNRMEAAFGSTLDSGPLIDWEKGFLLKIVRERYSKDDWNLKF